MAGMDKHKWSKASKERTSKDKAVYFYKCGFSRPNAKKAVPAVNLYHINQQALLGKLESEGGKSLFVFKGKILGTGSVSQPLLVKAYSWSKAVEKKLKEAGGEIAKLEA